MKGSLDYLLNPRSVVVIGASRDINSVGYGILRNLVKGCVLKSDYCGPFPGNVFAVNPNTDEVMGVKCHKRATDIKEDIDIAVIAVPAKIVSYSMKDCARKKIKVAIIVSAGFSEIGAEGRKMQNEVMRIAKKGGIRVVGPNCLGIIRPLISLNASFAPTMPPKGNVAFVSQSGALADSIIDWAIAEKYGFSAIISYGNKADLDVYDFIEWLEKDKETKAIALYIEGIDDGKKFMEVARKTTKTKPIIALKAGKTEKAVNAISTHTGSLAGSFQAYRAAFNQSGVINAETVEELFDLAKTTANQPVCKSNSIAIVTNGGGCGVLAADYCEMLGVNVVELKESTIKKLDKSGKMHPAYSRRNPLDLVGDALPERYEAAINTLLDEDYISGLIVIQTLQTMTSSEEDAKVVIEAAKKHPDKPILCVYMGGFYSRKGWRMLEDNGIPDFNDPKKAAIAMHALIKRGEYLRTNK